MTYIPYNSDEVLDAHWGCAWRSIQMVISQKAEVPSFRWIFSFFGQRVVLEDIYKAINNLTEVPNYLRGREYAPQDLKNGWAEPFIGYLIVNFLGYSSDLQLVNAYPPGANAPKEVFKAQPMKFVVFVAYMLEHFAVNGCPIMIDDSKYAMVIYAIARQENGSYVLKIGDPHIFSNLKQTKVGCYEVTLDEEGR